MDGVNAQKSLTRINYIDNALESKGIDRSFARWFQEKSVSQMKDVVRKRLSLSKDTDIHLAHLCYNRSMFLRDDDDFDMFRHFSLSAQSVDVAFSLPSDTTQNVRHVSTTPSTGTVQPAVSTPIPVVDTPQPPEPKKRKLNNSKKAAVPVEPQEILPVAPTDKSKPPKSKATTSRADKEVVQIPAPAPEPVPSTRTSKRKRADSVVAKPPPPAILKAKARASSVPPSSPQPAEGSLLSLKKKRKLKKKLTEADVEEAATESNDFARHLAKVISSVTEAAVEGKEPTPPRQRRKSAVAKAKADLASASNDNGISSDNHDVPSRTHSEPEPSASPAPENKKTPKKKKNEKLDPALLKAKEEQLAAARARLASSTVNAASTSSVVADSSINGHADVSASVSTKTNVTKKQIKKAKEKQHNVNGSSVVPSPPPPPDSDAESDVVAPVAGPSTRSKSNLTQAKTATFVKDKGKKETKGQAKEVAAEAEVGKETDSSEPQRSKQFVKLVPTMVGREKAEQGKLNGKVAPPGLPDTDTDSESSSSENSEVIVKNQSAKGKIQRMPPRIMEGNGELAELIRPRKSRVNLDKLFKQVEEDGEEEEGGILEEDEDEDWGKKKRSKASVRRAQSSSESEFEADDSPDTPVQTARPLPFTSTPLPGLRSATPPLSPQIQLVAPSSSQISKKPLAPLTSQVPPAIPAPDTPDDVIENVNSPEIMAPMEVDDIEPSDEPPKPSPRLSPTKIIKRMKGPTHSPRTLDRLHSSQSPLMFRRKLNHVGDSTKLIDFVAPSRSQSQSSSTTPVEKDDWTCLRNSPSIPDESVSMMVDELESSPQNNLQLNMEVEAEAEAEEQEEPLFINTETQIPFPFSQYQPERTPSPEVADDEGVPDSEDDDDDDEEAVAAAVRTNLHTPVSVYPRLTDIASQSKVFSRPQRVTRATAASQKTQTQMRNTASMYGSLVARDSDSDSDSGSDEAEAPSHIPKSRTAGRRK